jgi:hypothetical protein
MASMGPNKDSGSLDAKDNVEAVETLPAKKQAYRDDDLTGKDRAAEFLRNNAHEPVIVSPEDNKRILRKIDLTILPIMLVVYFLQQLDKSSLSYASVFGLIDHANLKGQDYSWLGSVVYIAQLVMQPLIAYFLVKLPTGKFAALMVFCWGTILCCMTAAKNFKGLLATRFFLGAFEASVGQPPNPFPC